MSWLREALLDHARHHGAVLRCGADQIRFLKTPGAWHEHLLEQLERVKRRVVVSALYVGQDAREAELVQAMAHALDRERDLRVTIVMDAKRATRSGKDNSLVALEPLLGDAKRAERVHVQLWKTPRLTARMERLVPERMVEGVGVFHLKTAVFDDNVVLTGANWSQSYFTDRQDRYMLVEGNRGLADFQEATVKVLDASPSAEAIKVNLLSLLAAQRARDEAADAARGDVPPAGNEVAIVPTFQFGHAGLYHDSHFFTYLLDSLEPGSHLDVSTAYFNMPSEYRQALLETRAERVRVAMAAPDANGFLGSAGPSGYIPDAYAYYGRRFADEIAARSAPVDLVPWSRPGWTFHGKGVWYRASASADPWLTVIGSANYGSRSVKYDIESNFYLMTDPLKPCDASLALNERMAADCANVFAHTAPADDRTLPRPRRIGALLARLGEDHL